MSGKIDHFFGQVLIHFYIGLIQLNFNGSNPDGSFTMDESNTFLSPQGFPPNTIYKD